MRLIWSRRAIRQLVAIRSSIAKDSEQNAALVASRILRCVELLPEHPDLGRPGRSLGTREILVPGTPFIVPYRVRREALELIAVLDGRREIAAAVERSPRKPK